MENWKQLQVSVASSPEHALKYTRLLKCTVFQVSGNALISLLPPQANKELTAARNKWQALSDFESCKETWMTCPIAELDPEEVQAKVEDLGRINYRALKVSEA